MTQPSPCPFLSTKNIEQGIWSLILLSILIVSLPIYFPSPSSTRKPSEPRSPSLSSPSRAAASHLTALVYVLPGVVGHSRQEGEGSGCLLSAAIVSLLRSSHAYLVPKPIHLAVNLSTPSGEYIRNPRSTTQIRHSLQLSCQVYSQDGYWVEETDDVGNDHSV